MDKILHVLNLRVILLLQKGLGQRLSALVCLLEQIKSYFLLYDRPEVDSDATFVRPCKKHWLLLWQDERGEFSVLSCVNLHVVFAAFPSVCREKAEFVVWRAYKQQVVLLIVADGVDFDALHNQFDLVWARLRVVNRSFSFFFVPVVDLKVWAPAVRWSIVAYW